MHEIFFKGEDDKNVTNQRIMKIVENIEERGIMQQYLFYWRRERGKNEL